MLGQCRQELFRIVQGSADRSGGHCLEGDPAARLFLRVHRVKRAENNAVFVGAERTAALQNQGNFPALCGWFVRSTDHVVILRFQQIPSVIPTALQQHVHGRFCLHRAASAVS